jgi:hypothetical protein
MQKSGQFRNRIGIGPLLAGICLAFMSQLPCGAEIDPNLVDPILQKEFQWAMFIEMNDNKPYLNYPGSKLNPLTLFRVTANTFQQGKNITSNSTPAQLYEVFWYRDEVPIGMRRFRALNIGANQIGAIFLGRTGNNSVAAAKVLVRLAVELDLQELQTSVVEVPLDQYDVITSELAHYSFLPRMSASKGRQFSIHLRSYPYSKDKDGYYYLQH